MIKKDEFNNLSIKQQIDYFNKQLRSGRSAAQINKELGYNESTTRKRFARNGYKLNHEKNKYLLHGDNNTTKLINNNDTSGNNSLEGENVNDDKNSISITELKTGDKGNIHITNAEMKENLIKLIKNCKEINEMLEWFKSRNGDKDNTLITIDLPSEKTIRTSVTLNETIWNNFNKFCNDNNYLKKQDMHSMALKEYMEKHNRK